MSLIAVLKEANTLILATDSRMMAHDYSGIASDSQQKVFEIAKDTFIATSGRAMASEFQVARAKELAAELRTTDIQTIGAALVGESLPCLTTLVERLRQESDETTKQHVSGESLLHGCMLVGRTAGGKLGYVFHGYRVQGGVVQCETESCFDAPRKVKFTSGGSLDVITDIASRFAQNPASWTDPLEQVSTRLIETMKRSIPTIGGPWQIVRLDARGAHWISPPRATVPSVGNLTAATIAASITMTSPSLVISGGSYTINLDSTLGFKLTKGSSYLQISGASTTFLTLFDNPTNNTISLGNGGVQVSDGSSNISSLSSNAVFCEDSSGKISLLTATGFSLVNDALPFTGTLAAAIAAGKSVQKGIIMN